MFDQKCELSRADGGGARTGAGAGSAAQRVRARVGVGGRARAAGRAARRRLRPGQGHQTARHALPARLLATGALLLHHRLVAVVVYSQFNFTFLAGSHFAVRHAAMRRTAFVTLNRIIVACIVVVCVYARYNASRRRVAQGNYSVILRMVAWRGAM